MASDENGEARNVDPVAEGEGDSLGEAKWSAMKELELRFPGLTADSVRFAVLEEPSGGRSARVSGEVDVEAWERIADRAAAEALRFDRPVELEPMRPGERKIVHMYLRERTDVETHSEGDEPERRLVITPL